MAKFHFYDSQILRVSAEELFDFLIQPQNLEKIMAKAMKVKVLNSTDEVIKKGTVIDYTFTKNGLPLRWQSSITEFEKNIYFADLQTQGPFAYWFHKHILKPLPDGRTEITDDLTYEPPLGFLGTIAQKIFIRHELKSVFEYRKKTMEQLFPG